MELLYIWVEEYNNISDQGFNLSSQFNFDISLKKTVCRLKLNLKQNYIPNFFGVDIYNVTGIVGENGSGKTSLLDLIQFIVTNGFYSYPIFVAVFKVDKTIITYHRLEKHKFYIDGQLEDYIIEKPVLFKEYKGLFNPTVPQIAALFDTALIFYTPLFDLRNITYSVRSNRSMITDISTNKLIDEDTTFYEQYAFSHPDKVEAHKFRNIVRHLELLESKIANFKGIHLPDRTEIRIKRPNIDPDNRDLSYEAREIFKILLDKAQEEVDDVEQRLYSYKGKQKHRKKDFDIYFPRKVKIEFFYALIGSFFYNLQTRKALRNEALKISAKDLVQGNLSIILKDFFRKQRWIERSYVMQFIEMVESLFDNFPADSGISRETAFILPNKVALEILNDYQKYILSISDKLDYQPNDTQTVGFLDFNWRDMSSGEKAYLDIFSRLLFAKKKLIAGLKFNEHKEVPIPSVSRVENLTCVYILIDEGDIGFHPQWQKEYLWHLLNFIKECFKEIKIQIFLTSHSPFLVSDLPKNNLIFLTQNEEGRCTVSKLDNDEETFGGNIHTLYTDAFFMKEGLLSKFAKEKMDEVLKPLMQKQNLAESEEEIIQKFINIIGEPIIKHKLQEILNKKIHNNVRR